MKDSDNMLIKTALDYAEENNFSIIPLQKNKKPFIQWTEFQHRKATADEIKSWWDKWPSAMIGIVTGQISGLFVVDCDTQQGYETVQELLPDSLQTPIARTPRNGWHIYFQYPPDSNMTVQAAVMPGVDYRGEGGYIVAPPSMNGNGKGYEWLEGLSLNECPAAPVPGALLGALYNNINNYIYGDKVTKEDTDCKRLQLTSGDFKMFEHGRRDNDLFHVAYSLVKGGMAEKEIAQTLERLVISWNEEPDKKWIQAKIKSAFQRAEKKEINIAQEVRDFVVTSSGFFLTSDVFNRLQVTSRQARKNVVLSLLRLHKEGILERHGQKMDSIAGVENEIEEVNYLNAPTDDFRLPCLWAYMTIANLYPGNIVIIAGSKSAGKTAFLLNTVRENMQQHEVVYLNSEMGDTEFRKRLELFRYALIRLEL